MKNPPQSIIFQSFGILLKNYISIMGCIFFPTLLFCRDYWVFRVDHSLVLTNYTSYSSLCCMHFTNCDKCIETIVYLSYFTLIQLKISQYHRNWDFMSIKLKSKRSWIHKRLRFTLTNYRLTRQYKRHIKIYDIYKWDKRY